MSESLDVLRTDLPRNNPPRRAPPRPLPRKRSDIIARTFKLIILTRLESTLHSQRRLRGKNNSVSVTEPSVAWEEQTKNSVAGAEKRSQEVPTQILPNRLQRFLIGLYQTVVSVESQPSRTFEVFPIAVAVRNTQTSFSSPCFRPARILLPMQSPISVSGSFTRQRFSYCAITRDCVATNFNIKRCCTRRPSRAHSIVVERPCDLNIPQILLPTM